jgi:hypothetical protein
MVALDLIVLFPIADLKPFCFSSGSFEKRRTTVLFFVWFLREAARTIILFFVWFLREAASAIVSFSVWFRRSAL